MRNTLEKYIYENKTPVRDMGYAKLITSFFGLSKNDFKTILLDNISVENLINILNTELVDGYNELMCHPRRIDKRIAEKTYSKIGEAELNTLLSKQFSEFLKNNSEIKLVSWNHIKF